MSAGWADQMSFGHLLSVIVGINSELPSVISWTGLTFLGFLGRTIFPNADDKGKSAVSVQGTWQ